MRCLLDWEVSAFSVHTLEAMQGIRRYHKAPPQHGHAVKAVHLQILQGMQTSSPVWACRVAEIQCVPQERVFTPLCRSAAPLSALPKAVCCGPTAADAEGEWLGSDVGARVDILALSEESSADAVT